MANSSGPVAMVRHALGALIRALSAVGEALIAALAVFVALDAVLRWAINWSFLVTDELGGYALVIISFFGMAVALHDRALFRVEVLFHRFSERRQERMQLLFDIVSLAFASLLAWQLVGLVLRSYDRGIVAPTVLRTPLWIPQAGMAAGGVIVVLVLLLQVHDGLVKLRADSNPSKGG